MRWEVPDRTEDHYPQGGCVCGQDLADAADLGVARSYQQEEIPAAPAERVQHDLHEAECACGRVHAAARPAGVPDSALSIGPRLRALAVYLVVFQHVPVGRCQQLIADVSGAAVSAGFVHSCLRQAASLAAEVVRLIRALITAAAVAGFDETTLRSGPAGDKKYVHGAFTEEYSAFRLGTRSLDSMQDAGILPGFAGSWSPTATRTTSISGGSTSPGTRRAWLTSCATTRTAPRPTPARSGRCRRSGRCAA
ncbi:MAG: IS66 family transposase [Micromonosporaceae bacterium]